MSEEQNDLPTRKEGGRELQNTSWIERMFGKYTQSIILLSLFVVTMTCLLMYVGVLKGEDKTIIIGLINLLHAGVGYFVGKKSN